MSDRQHPEAIVEYDDDSYVMYDGSTGGGHPLGEWAEVWLSFYDADGNRTERVYRAKDRLPLGWEVAPDLYEALEPVFRDARLAEYFCANDVPEDHQVLVSFTMAELRKALAAYQRILSPQAREQGEDA